MRLLNVKYQRKIFQSTAFAFAIIYFITPLFAFPIQGNLSIKVTGAENNKGNLIVYVFRKQDDIFKSKPYHINQGKIYSGESRVCFKNIPFSRYSIMAFHDVNNNNIMDHHFMKLPTEAFSFSNNWNLSLLSGKLTFKKTSVSFSKDQSEIQVEVK